MKRLFRTLALTVPLLALLFSPAVPGQKAGASAAGTLELFTPYLEWSAAPGESVSYTIDIMNQGSRSAVAQLSLDLNGNEWDYQLTAGGRDIKAVAVKAGETQTVNLQLEVPLQVDKGRYTFELNAAGQGSLPFAVNVSEQGTFKTEFSVDQPNLEGHADTTFTYSATLRNRTAEEQTYALNAQAEEGWDVRFKADGSNVTSVQVEPAGEKTVSVEIIPSAQAKAGTYEIPLAASSNVTDARTTVEAVITGSYDMQFSTADGRLSGEIKAGGQRKLDFTVTNTGSAELEDLSFSSSGTPSGWEVSFEPSTVRTIPPGGQASVQATIKAGDKSLPGDYALSVSASSPSKSASADLRMTVKASVLWGWVGILIIAAVCGGIYFLFRKYGRR